MTTQHALQFHPEVARQIQDMARFCIMVLSLKLGAAADQVLIDAKADVNKRAQALLVARWEFPQAAPAAPAGIVL